MVVPEVKLRSGHTMPAVGLGTASYPPATAEQFETAILDAIAAGIRHFDTASMYGTEQRLGQALAEALRRGLVKSRDELFVTTKIWAADAHPDRVLPALRHSLQTLQLEYVDLYLIHWPLSLKTEDSKFPVDKPNFLPLDLKSVWEVMEECQRLGLVKSIGVEMHPIWQQKKLIDFCNEKGIHVSAYSPLGGQGTPWGTNNVMECDVLKAIALARGKSVAQISLRWIYEQGTSVIFKTFKKERMSENLDIFDWKLDEDELHKIAGIHQSKGVTGKEFVSETGPYKSIEEIWDGEI